jgi:hypothetical protein
MNASERTRNRLEGRAHRGMAHGLGLELRERALEIGERGLRLRADLHAPCPLDLMKRPHRLRDGSRELEQLGRHVRVSLKRAQSSRKRLARGSR